MLLTGTPVSADGRRSWGWSTGSSPPTGSTTRSASWPTRSSRPARRPPLGKPAFYELLDLAEAEAYGRAAEVMADNAVRADAREGIARVPGKAPARLDGS